jgi:hypothetical protein
MKTLRFRCACSASCIAFLLLVVPVGAEAAADDAMQKPALPGHLQFATSLRPWGDTYLPKSKPPSRELQVVDSAEQSDNP